MLAGASYHFPMHSADTALERLIRSGRSEELLRDVMEAAREHLSMDISFLAEFGESEKVLREVAGEAGPIGFERGASIPLEDTYCIRLVRGETSGVIPDSSRDAVVRDLPITHERKIGSYIGVPVHLSDGRLYGTLCCISREPTADLSEKDRKFLKALAQVVAVEIEREDRAASEARRKIEAIRNVIEAGGPAIALQPIMELKSRRVVGMEALSRFHAEPQRGPDVWFDEAWSVGLGPELELAAMRNAMKLLSHLPDDSYLGVNLSPQTVQSGGFDKLLEGFPAERLVVEVTEHAAVEEFELVVKAIEELRALGSRLAVDDLGAGYAGLSQALRLAPEILKLDNFLIAGIENDPARQALAFAVASFSHMTGGSLVAEGIETEAALNELIRLGVQYGQGYFLGRPQLINQKSRS